MAVTAQVNVKIDSSQAEKTVGKLNETISNSAKSANSLRAELKQTVQELQNLQPGSARFQELSARAGELKDQIQDTNAVVNQLAGNVGERLVRGVTNVVQVGVAGFQALQSGIALFGVESEEVQQTMVRLTALLNLSQAVETFANLDQKIVEIRASFQSLTTATVAQTVATEGEAVATTGAAVATTALGTAMKALPIIAIVAALGTLAYGLYQYATASGEADKNEKKRKANLEALNKAEKEQTETIAKESAEFVGLIYQLKATNTGTKERQTLIKQINSTYGTTLKNLKDETAFQAQLNLEVANYITYQKAKFQLQKNEELIQKNLEKQETLTKKLKDAQFALQLQQNILADFNKRQDPLGIEQQRDNVEAAANTVQKYKDEIAAAEKRLEAYGKVNLDVNSVIQEVTNSGKKYTDQTKTSTDTTDKNTEALEKQKDALSNLQALYARQIDAEKQLEVFERGLMTISSSMQMLDEDGNKITQSTSSKTGKYFQDIFEIEQGFRDKQNALLEQATQRELEKYEESILGKNVSEKDYYNARKKIIDEGVNYLIESEQLLMYFYGKESEKQVKRYIDEQELKTNIANDTTNKINADISLLNLQFAKEQRIKDVENAQLTEEEKNKEILQIRKDFLDQEIYLIEFNAKRQKDILDSQKELDILNAENNSAEILLIEKKYNKDLLDLTQSTQTQIQDLTTETTEVQKTQIEKLTESLDSIDEYLAAVQSLFSDFESALTNLTEQQNEVRLQSYQDYLTNQTALLDSQLAQRLITQEEYDNQVQQLQQEQEQKEREIAKKTFQTNKRLNLVGATIDGARAVISTFANTPGELIIKSIAAALAGVFAATQIAVIAKSSFQAATGGIVPGMGSGEIDSVSASLAPGEAVINSKSTNQFLPVLDAINQAGGGRSLMPNLPATNQGQKFEVVFPDNKQQEPVRAYVVESDISDAQRRVNRIENSTRF